MSEPEGTGMEQEQRIDKYADDRRKLRDGTRATAMKRLWEMGREGLAMRARMGVKKLEYETDLIPGVENVRLRATEHWVEFTLTGVDWRPDKGGDFADRKEKFTYIVDEAWLLA